MKKLLLAGLCAFTLVACGNQDSADTIHAYCMQSAAEAGMDTSADNIVAQCDCVTDQMMTEFTSDQVSILAAFINEFDESMADDEAAMIALMSKYGEDLTTAVAGYALVYFQCALENGIPME